MNIISFIKNNVIHHIILVLIIVIIFLLTIDNFTNTDNFSVPPYRRIRSRTNDTTK